MSSSETPILVSKARTPATVDCSKVQRVTGLGLATTASKDSGGSR